MTENSANDFDLLTFDTPDIMSVLLLVGVFFTALVADSVSCLIAVSATGSSPLERWLSAVSRDAYKNH